MEVDYSNLTGQDAIATDIAVIQVRGGITTRWKLFCYLLLPKLIETDMEEGKAIK